MSLTAKSKTELMEGAKTFIAQWKQLGFKDELDALNQWEVMIFQIARFGNVSLIHQLKEDLTKWILEKQ